MTKPKRNNTMEEPKVESVITRRSSSYTTHFVNGAIFHHSEDDEGVVICDFLFRSGMPGEPYERDIDEDGARRTRPHKTMTEENVLVGLAMDRETLVRIASIILEEFGDDEKELPESGGILAKIETAIEGRRKLLKMGHMPDHWNHFPHDDDDYHDNQLRSEMNGLELAKWILLGEKGRKEKWG